MFQLKGRQVEASIWRGFLLRLQINVGKSCKNNLYLLKAGRSFVGMGRMGPAESLGATWGERWARCGLAARRQSGTDCGSGLFKELAIACYPEPFHHVSCCLVAKAMGAIDVSNPAATSRNCFQRLPALAGKLVRRLGSRSSQPAEARPARTDADSAAAVGAAAVVVDRARASGAAEEEAPSPSASRCDSFAAALEEV